MKICVFTQTFPRYQGDPVAPFMRDFCQGLVKAGNKVIVLAPYDSKFSLRKKKEDFKIKLYKYVFADRLHLLGYSRTLIGDQRFKLFVYPLAPLMFLFSFLALLRLIYQEKIEIISAHWILPNGFIAALVSKITGIPLVISIPGSDIYLAKKNFIFRSMALLAVRQSKAVVSNSRRYLEEFSKSGINLENSLEIPYGVDVKKYQYPASQKIKMRRKLGFLKNDLIILAVGRLVEKKGYEYLIKAMPIILRKKKQVRLVLIGNGAEKSKLIKIAKDLKISNKVFFLGKVNYDQLSKFYSLADLFIAPSIKDSQGNLESHIVALFEAMASGLPIVATELAVSEKYVIDGVNGYRVKQRNKKALALGVLSILDSPNRFKMGEKSKLIAKKHLSYETSGKEYTKIFKSF